MSDSSRFVSYSTTAKAHQLAMLYVERRFSEQSPSVDELMTEYQEAVKEIATRLKGASFKF